MIWLYACGCPVPIHQVYEFGSRLAASVLLTPRRKADDPDTLKNPGKLVKVILSLTSCIY
jgi:hypothetical protein